MKEEKTIEQIFKESWKNALIRAIENSNNE